MPSQTHIDLCLLVDSKSRQDDKINHHSWADILSSYSNNLDTPVQGQNKMKQV